MKILKVKGKDYLVHYTINSLVRMEEETGKSFTEMLGDEDGLSISDLRDIIFYGLISKQHEFTRLDAGNIIDSMVEEGLSIVEVSQKFLSELTRALGMKTTDADEEDGNVPN
jgi:hypothetical protein